MSKLIWHTMMSLDGFVAGPDDSMDWAFKASGSSPLADEVQERAGAILGGRRWYDVATAKYDGLDGVYGGSWDGPVVVLTSHPDDAPAHPSVSFVSDGLTEAVAAARAAAAGKDVAVFGASTAQQCVEVGLLDEIVIHLAPVLLGDGVRLYGRPGASRLVDLEGRTTDLRYLVPKSK
jgi:dihydrofolate reductase